MRASILAIDPGPERSAFVLLDGARVVEGGKLANDDVLAFIRSTTPPRDVVLEMVASYGMPVGEEVFETVFWIGRFAQVALDRGHPMHRRFRPEVKLHHCHSARAKDGNIRQAMIDRYGGKNVAIGSKKAPGPLYGITADVWQALALGLMFSDTMKNAVSSSKNI